MAMAVMPVPVLMMVVVVTMIVSAAALRTMLVLMARRGLNVQHVAGAVFVVVVLVLVMIVVVVVTMLVVVMLLAMMAMIVMGMLAMIMPAAARLAMRVMVMAVVMSGVPMRLGGFIGATFGLERRLDHLDAGAEAARHLFQNRIAGDADAVGQQFGRHMAVAEVPGKTREMMGVLRHDLGHRLFRRNHRHGAPVFERDPVILLQPGGFRQVEQERHVAFTAHGDAAPVPAVMRQHHAVRRGGDVPGSGRQKRTGTDHDRLSSGDCLRKGGEPLRRYHAPDVCFRISPRGRRRMRLLTDP